MNDLAATVALFGATALPIAAQTDVLVAKSRVPASVAFDDSRNLRCRPPAMIKDGRK